MKIVIVARHPGAAVGARAVATVAASRGFDVEFLATEPAFSALVAADAGPVCSPATAGRRYRSLPAYGGAERVENGDLADRAATVSFVVAMAAWIERYLEASRPDALVMMDASEQLGVDQVAAVAARRLGIPAVRVRDGWGVATGVETRGMRETLPASVADEAIADRYFEIDGHGARLSIERLGIPADRIVILNGLTTLDRFTGCATMTAFAEARAALGIPMEQPLIVYFSQPTRRETAEAIAFDAFLDMANVLDFARSDVVLATQEHPRENDRYDGMLGLGWTARRAAERYAGKVIDLTPRVIVERSMAFEQTMLAADLYVSTYSNSSIEATALGALASGDLEPRHRPIGMHLICPDAVRAVMKRSRAGRETSPFTDNGALPCARTEADLRRLVHELVFEPARREPYFEAMRSRYNVGRCAAAVLDGVAALVAERGRPRP